MLFADTTFINSQPENSLPLDSVQFTFSDYCTENTLGKTLVWQLKDLPFDFNSFHLFLLFFCCDTITLTPQCGHGVLYT